jgi:hypothetical protein
MFEYSVVLGNDLSDVWSGHILPLLDMVRNSPFFWPAVVAVGVILVVVTRQIIK